MDYTLKAAHVIDPQSTWNGKKVDIRIADGRIVEIGKSLQVKGTIIESKQLHVSPGWIDMSAHFCDPGHEYKEDLRSGAAAARAGGFTSVLLMPDTQPVMDNKGAIRYATDSSQQSDVRIYAAASLSKGMEGKEMCEMVDLHQAGAKLFVDDAYALRDSSLMLRSLLYARDIDARIAVYPSDSSLSPSGMMHEGKVSTRLGLKGVPDLVEGIALKRDIDLLRYSGGRLHVKGLSTAEGVKLVKAAKREGLRITAEVFMAHLIWSDEQLADYDSNYKMQPPLRAHADRKALRKAVVDGTIDCISSEHRPEDVEHKKVEFGQAAHGIALIESFYAQYQSHLSEEITLERFVECLTYAPCQLLKTEAASIEIERKAILTCFDPSVSAAALPLATKAYNTPCIHPEMKGQVICTIR